MVPHTGGWCVHGAGRSARRRPARHGGGHRRGACMHVGYDIDIVPPHRVFLLSLTKLQSYADSNNIIRS